MYDDYARAVTVLRVIDGDTFKVDVDLGFMVHVVLSCRIFGINAPELKETGGVEARNRLAELLAQAPITVTSVQLDKYAGRFDALVYDRTGQELGQVMISEHHAVAWNGVGPKPKLG